MRTRIKMCGTTRLEDARAAVDLGVDALGFIFVKKSPRYITPQSAASIITQLPSFVGRVGVFVNQDLDDIKSIVAVAGLTQLQLHGDESADFCSALKEWNRSLSICKAFRVGEGSPKIDSDAYHPCIHSVLLDTYVTKQEGGTGLVFDWSIVDSLGLDRPLILAGGLTPENIEEALKMLNPFAVDINSGVEDLPGVKNHEKLSRLILQVGEYDDRRRKCSRESGLSTMK